jgi:hypothetical protein
LRAFIIISKKNYDDEIIKTIKSRMDDYPNFIFTDSAINRLIVSPLKKNEHNKKTKLA